MAQQKKEEKQEEQLVCLTDIVVDARDHEAAYDDYITEVEGESNDINKGFGGKFVYLKAVYGPAKNAISDIKVVQGVHLNKDKNVTPNLAEGAGGDYRQLQLVRNGKEAIKTIKLWRTKKKSSKPSKEGWHYWCSDLNYNRDGDYLYLCYEKVDIADVQKKRVTILSIKYDLDKAKMGKKTPMIISEQEFVNNGSVQASMQFKVDKGVSHTSSFTRTHGFEVEVGRSFEAAIPEVGKAGIKIGVKTSHEWQFGEENTFKEDYEMIFPVKAPAHSHIIARALVWRNELDVPYAMTLKLGDGSTQKSFGIWTGVTTFNIRYEINEVNK